MKRIISLILVAILLCSVFAFVPSAEAQLIAGDATRDGVIDSQDALLALQYTVSKISLDFDTIHLSDVNYDGKTSSTDALLILQRSVGKISAFENAQQIVDTTYNLGEAALENNAYTDDLSADTSFVIDNTGLSPETIYYVCFSTAGTPSIHTFRFLYALQGIINRDFGRDTNHTSLIYFQYDNSDPQ